MRAGPVRAVRSSHHGLMTAHPRVPFRCIFSNAVAHNRGRTAPKPSILVHGAATMCCGAQSSPALAAAHHLLPSGCTISWDGCRWSLLQGWSAERWIFDVLHSVHISACVRQRVARGDGESTMVEWCTSRAVYFYACTLRTYRQCTLGDLGTGCSTVCSAR